MKTCILVVFCLLAIACVACEGKSVPFSLQGLGDKSTEAKESIKLGAIWSNCGNSNDMSIIHNVTITPNPPSKNKPVTIDAWFTLKEGFTGGSFTAKVKYSFLPSLKQSIDLCDLAKMAGLKCPISQNTTNIVVTQDIPSLTPSGHYTGQVIGVDQNGKRIGCINFDLHI